MARQAQPLPRVPRSSLRAQTQLHEHTNLTQTTLFGELDMRRRVMFCFELTAAM